MTTFNKVKAAAVGLLLSVSSAALAFASPIGAQMSIGVVPFGPGLTDNHLVTTASTNATVFKAGPGTLYTIVAQEASAAVFIHFYNSATTPTCGTSPAYLTVEVPATTSPTGTFKLDLSVNFGVAFNSGISACVTGAVADTDTSNATAGAIIDIIRN